MLRRQICLSRISDFVIYMYFFAYFKFHSDWGRVIGKQNELDCRDTAPLKNESDLKKIGNNAWKWISLVSLVLGIITNSTKACLI